MFRKVVFILSGVLFFAAGSVLSQNPQILFPYSCSFEDPVENANWVLNSPRQNDGCNDRWHVGKATFTDGDNSIYISTNAGKTAAHGFTPNIVWAYRLVEFQAGSYVISFDWNNDIDEARRKDNGLYFYIIPENLGAPVSSKNSYSIANIKGKQAAFLQGDGVWQNHVHTETFNKTTRAYICFGWQNSQTDTLWSPLGACIDNIQIVPGRCPVPRELKYRYGCDFLTISWVGQAAEYEMEYRRNGTQKWRKIEEKIYNTSYTLVGLAEGAYDVRLRGVCNSTDTSAYLSRMGIPVFCPESHCINYVDLYNAPEVTCHVGRGVAGAMPPCQPYDFGSMAMKSRHTVCWTKNQYDPLTEFKLKTIPDGEIASVRLGNWDTNMETERIEYKYAVDPVNPGILILKYAVVLQDPGHSQAEQPFFQLVLKDKRGRELDPTCGKAEFYAGSSNKGWNTAYPYGQNGSGWKDMVVTWKDWTTMGLNLQQYAGVYDTIIISCTTKDCMQGAHFGYAYFTLGCSDGTIESVTCGAEEDQYIQGPVGFNYQWFKEYDEDGNPSEVLSTDDKFKVPVSSDPYHLRCSYKENPDCYFDLATVVAPRFPYADFEVVHNPSDCVNRYRLMNKSHVIYVYDDRDGDGQPDTVHTNEPVDDFEWDFYDNSDIFEESPAFVAPQEGITGKKVKLTVSLSGGECVDVKDVEFDIPSILSEPTRLNKTVCPESFPYNWENGHGMSMGVFGAPGVKEYIEKNIAGCDSVTILTLESYPEVGEVHIDTTICFGERVVIEDRLNQYRCDASGHYEYRLLASTGCDSVVILDLTVRDSVAFTYTTTPEAVVPNSGSISLNVLENPEDGYTYSIDGVAGGALTGLKGGVYEVIVFDSVGCASVPVDIIVDRECLVVDVDLSSQLIACADDSSIVIPCTIVEGTPSTYSIEYGQHAKDAGFVDVEREFTDKGVLIEFKNCTPDYYDANLIIKDPICGDKTYPLTFSIHYAASIVRQKWNDVFAVTNENYNGGNTFLAYQWYKNDAPIAGAINSYYYLGDDMTFDVQDVYYVMLTRIDGVTLPTCPFSPVLRPDDIQPYPIATVVQAGTPLRIMNIQSKATVGVWSVSGVHYFTGEIDVDNDEIDMPPYPGVYIIVIERNGIVNRFKVITD